MIGSPKAIASKAGRAGVPQACEHEHIVGHVRLLDLLPRHLTPPDNLLSEKRVIQDVLEPSALQVRHRQL